MAPPATAAPHPAPAKQPIVVLLSSDNQKLVTSTGQTLYLSVELENDTFKGEPPDSELYVFVSSNDGENHDWSWSDIATGDLTFDSTSGMGEIVTEDQLGSWGALDLTIAPRASSPTTSCDGREQDWAVTVNGTMWFTTHSTAWGAFGSRSAPLTVSDRAAADTYYTSKALNDCGSSQPKRHCNGQVTWDDSGGNRGVTDGESVRRNGVVDGELAFLHSHTLDNGNGPQRDDFIIADTVRPPEVVKAHGKTEVRVRVKHTGCSPGRPSSSASVSPRCTSTSASAAPSRSGMRATRPARTR